MPTAYEEIYTVFQSQISDGNFNNLIALEELEKQYLLNSIPKFRRCFKDLNDRSDIDLIFNINLSLDEIQILGNLMVVEYLSSQIVSIELIKQALTSKDFGLTSQANHLEKLLLLRTDRKKEISKMIVDYSFSFGDLAKLR